MKNQILKLLLILIFLTLQSNASDRTDKELDSAEQVVKQLIMAMAEKNGPEIRAAFAKDATQLYERWYARKKTGASFWDWLESDIIETQGKVIEPKYNVDVNSVIVTGIFENNDDYRSPADFLFTVKEGKITSWTIRYD